MVSLLYQEIFQAALPSVAAALTHLSAALKNPLAVFFLKTGKIDG
jgi:ADP-heptose:LPS heptosyltransferase